MFIALLAVFDLSSYYKTTIPVFIAKHSSFNEQCFYGIFLAWGNNARYWDEGMGDIGNEIQGWSYLSYDAWLL
jgi:hypothetical protein